MFVKVSSDSPSAENSWTCKPIEGGHLDTFDYFPDFNHILLQLDLGFLSSQNIRKSNKSRK